MSERIYELTARDFDLPENEIWYDEYALEQYLKFDRYESAAQYRGFFHRQNEPPLHWPHREAIREVIPSNINIVAHNMPIYSIGSAAPVGYHTTAPDTVKISIICPLCDGRLHYSSAGRAPLYRRPEVQCYGCGATLIINCEGMV